MLQFAADLRKRHEVSRKKLKQIVEEVSQLTGLRDVGSSRKYLRCAIVVPTKSDSDVIFCLQLLSKRKLVHPTCANANR